MLNPVSWIRPYIFPSTDSTTPAARAPAIRQTAVDWLRPWVEYSFRPVVDNAEVVQGWALRALGFSSVWENVPGVGRVHLYVRESNNPKPTRVFIHGYASQGADWMRMVLSGMRRSGTMVIVDLPGHGASVAPKNLTPELLHKGCEQAVLQRMDRLGCSKFCLIGNSMGALGAHRVQQHCPDRVTHEVMISPAGAPMRAQEYRALEHRLIPATFAAALGFMRSVFPDGIWFAWFTAWGAFSHLTRPQYKQLLQAYPDYPPLSPRELQTAAPTLLIVGDKDITLPESCWPYFAEHLPAATSKFVRPTGLAHSPYLQPGGADALWREIDAFEQAQALDGPSD